MRAILIVIWLVVSLTGLALFSFFPKVFEPLLCEADEFIEHQTHEISDASGTSWSTDLYCVNPNGNSRAVGEKVGVPFVLTMVVLPFVVLYFNRGKPKETDSADIADDTLDDEISA